MVSFVSVEYLKIAGYLVAGFASARVWFTKEITAGRALLRYYESLVRQKAVSIEGKVKADATAVETAVKSEVKKIENKL